MGDVSEPQAALGTPKANRGHENLIPAKPGEVRNPTGKNQYTDSPVRRFEAAVQQRATERAEEILATLFDQAIEGNEQMMRMILERMVRKVEHIDEDTGATKATRLEVVFVKPDTGDE